jgi:HlyD family secretion protein
MNLKKFFPWTFVFVGIMIAASACTGRPSQSVSTPEPETQAEFNPVVSATGVIVPAEWAHLSATGSGTIEEILTGEGENVEKGKALIRLAGSEKIESSIAAAHFELVTAQRALDDLYKNPELRLAQARQDVIDARLAIRDAERRVNNLSTASSQADIDQARAVVTMAKDKLDKARKDYKPYKNKPEDNLIRAALLNRQAQAEQVYDAAVRRLNNLLGTANELDLGEAKSDLELAKAQLDVAERDVEIYQKGPDPVDITVAEERISNAKSQLAAAEAALDDLVVTAPFAGTTSEINIHAGEWIALGQNLLLLADLEHLRVETTDLSEIDVARVKVGDSVVITFDALPEVTATGNVTRIGVKADQGAGVNYTVVIEFGEVPANLRWGMTAFVDIQVE